MVVVVVILLALLALFGVLSWLRPGGGYDEKTVGRIGPEPPDWKAHDQEPWEADPKLSPRSPSSVNRPG